jgi:hypothetical protein
MDFSKHTQGTTSVKVHHAPGGQSSFSLAWDAPPASKNQKTVGRNPITNEPLKESNQQIEAKTSVKVRNPPGGRSNIIFG